MWPGIQARHKNEWNLIDRIIISALALCKLNRTHSYMLATDTSMINPKVYCKINLVSENAIMILFAKILRKVYGEWVMNHLKIFVV